MPPANRVLLESPQNAAAAVSRIHHSSLNPMPIADILIAIMIIVSMVVGLARGFVKEAISIASLLIAIWAALFLGPRVGAIADTWLSSAELQAWFGRILVFVVVLMIGGLLGWGISRLVRLSILSGTDRVLGLVFGFCRGALLFGLVVIGGQFAGFNNDEWWQKSALMPYGEFVADWIGEMAPRGLELLQPGEIVDPLATALPDGNTGPAGITLIVLTGPRTSCVA